MIDSGRFFIQLHRSHKYTVKFIVVYILVFTTSNLNLKYTLYLLYISIFMDARTGTVVATTWYCSLMLASIWIKDVKSFFGSMTVLVTLFENVIHFFGKHKTPINKLGSEIGTTEQSICNQTSIRKILTNFLIQNQNTTSLH